MTANSIALLKVTLDDVKPAVQRQLTVPIGIRLDRRHLVLQAALGWTNSHLYEFKARDVGWGMPDPDFGYDPLNTLKARLIDVFKKFGVKTMNHLYDFGNGWEHTVKLERLNRQRRSDEPVPNRRDWPLSTRSAEVVGWLRPPNRLASSCSNAPSPVPIVNPWEQIRKLNYYPAGTSQTRQCGEVASSRR